MQYHFFTNINKNENKIFPCLQIPELIVSVENYKDPIPEIETTLNNFIEKSIIDQRVLGLPSGMFQESPYIISAEVDSKLVFSFLLKNTKIQNNLSDETMAELLNFDDIDRYQEFEMKSNPTLEEIKRVKEILPLFPHFLLF